ncbi:MAG: APC family permease [Bdellovibrionota bacterium]
MAKWNWEKLSEPFSIKENPSKRGAAAHKARAGQDIVPKKHQKLGQWLATGICGNDITSSCLYVAAIATAYAGVYSPLVLLMVGGLLYLYRFIYSEVGDALPLNGGAYNALLNTTTKLKASIAACMTLLSYLATACISAKTAVEYLGTLLPGGLPIVFSTVVLLSIFALLAIWGIGESAVVALCIFVFHLLTLGIFSVIGLGYLFHDPSVLIKNWHAPSEYGLISALFFGFSAALLGISGFESSANYIEEQEPGVFPKTLRNMWVAVTVLNPLIALIALAVIPISVIEVQKDSLLATVSSEMVGIG